VTPAEQPTNQSQEAPVEPDKEPEAETEPAEVQQQPLAAPTQPTPNGPSKPSVGTGSAALRNASSLPRGGASGIARGQRGVSHIARGASTGIPRGAPRGGGFRGGPRSVSTGPGANNRGGPASSPTRGGLNPAANHFQPGGKRAREDGDGADGGQKRMRGGGHGQ
jgi:hypothetical protein